MTPKPPPVKKTKNAGPSIQAPKIITDDVVKSTPPFIALNAVPHFGKTTAVAYAPVPLIIMAPREFGYLTLRGEKRVPKVGHVKITRWEELIALLQSLREDVQSHKTISIDASSGMEELCENYVCDTYFNSEWGKKEGEYHNYGAGASRTKQEWSIMLNLLDDIRWKFDVTIVMISHVKIKTIRKPGVIDYDCYIPDLNDKTWGAICKLADTILFGDFKTVVDPKATSQKGHGKGIGGTERVIYTGNCDAYPAKNRYGMPSEIKLSNDYRQTWKSISDSMKGASKDES